MDLLRVFSYRARPCVWMRRHRAGDEIRAVLLLGCIMVLTRNIWAWRDGGHHKPMRLRPSNELER